MDTWQLYFMAIASIRMHPKNVDLAMKSMHDLVDAHVWTELEFASEVADAMIQVDERRKKKCR